MKISFALFCGLLSLSHTHTCCISLFLAVLCILSLVSGACGPGRLLSFQKKKVANREEKEREKAEKQQLKVEKEREKAEKQKEKDKEKGERHREKEKEKEEKQREKEEKKEKDKDKEERRGSFFRTLRGGSGTIKLKLKAEEDKEEEELRMLSIFSPFFIFPATTLREDAAKVYFKGYLHKKNEVLPGGKTPNRNWLSYWVVLRSQYLLFYSERKHVGGLFHPLLLSTFSPPPPTSLFFLFFFWATVHGTEEACGWN